MIRIAVLYPDLLGTYGDGGNAQVLECRARWRGLEVAVAQVLAGDEVPDADLYLLGGGEDGPQARAADLLQRDRGLHRAVDRGATVFAVCAGYQILGHHFISSDGSATPGLGLLDVETVRTDERRAVGEVLAEVVAPGWTAVPTLTGFENHGGRTRLGAGVEPLAHVEYGVGNGEDATEGAVAGNVVATYLHGPVLARNPGLADALLERVVGVPLPPLNDERIERLREDRLALRP